MKRYEVTEPFTLGRFDELTNIERKGADIRGKLNIGDTFSCSDELADYLMGNNPKNKIVVKLIEIIPEIKVVSQSPIEEVEKYTVTANNITTASYTQTKPEEKIKTTRKKRTKPTKYDY